MGVTGCRCEKPARATLLACAVICAAVAACGQDSDPGPAITTEPLSEPLTWTGDDSEIVFVVCCQHAPESLKAFRISDGMERTLDSGKFYATATSQPGSDVFFLAQVSSSPIV